MRAFLVTACVCIVAIALSLFNQRSRAKVDGPGKAGEENVAEQHMAAEAKLPPAIRVAHKEPVFDIRKYGAKVDGKATGDGWAQGSNAVSDCWTTTDSDSLKCATGHFDSSDVGKALVVSGALAGGRSLRTRISRYIAPNHIIMVDAATLGMGSSTVPISYINISAYGNGGYSTATCTGRCNLTPGQWAAIQRADALVYNAIVQVVSVPDGTHFTFLNVSGADPSVPATKGVLDGRSPRVVWGTDDTAAIQSTMDAAGAAGGGAVYFPRGIALATYLRMGCSKLGKWRFGVCARVYNNIEIYGDGRGVSTLEGINAAPGTATPVLLGVGGVWGNGAELAASSPQAEPGNDWLRGFSFHDLTIRQPFMFASGEAQPLGIGYTWNAEIFNAEFVSNASECLYAMNNYGAKIHGNIAGPCGRSAYNLCGESEEAWNNKTVVSGQCAELGETFSKFHDNFCDTRARAIQYGINIGSTVRGIWENEISNNTVIGAGIVLSNVNGVACNNRVLNNKFTDGGLSVNSGLDYNKLESARVNKSTCPGGHGLTTVSGNTVIADLRGAPIALAGLESYVAENNVSVSRSARCIAGPGQNRACRNDGDCPGSFCATNSAGLQLSGDPTRLFTWTPNTAHAQYHYVLPPLPNGWMYVNLGRAGKSGSTEPAWCERPGCTVADGDLVWTNRGRAKSVQVKNTKVTVEKPPDTKYRDLYSNIAYLNSLPREAAQITGFTLNVPYAWGAGAFGANNDVLREPAYGNIPAGAVYGDAGRWWSGPAPPDHGYWKKEVHIQRTDADATLAGWTVTTAGWSAPNWKPLQLCQFGVFVLPSKPKVNGHFYRAVNAANGSTGKEEPRWPASANGELTDGTCKWKEAGAAAMFAPLAGASPHK